MLRHIITIMMIVASVGVVSALDVDLSGVDLHYNAPIILSGCVESSIGCSRIVSDPIDRDVSVATEPVNATHDAWTATVRVSTSFSGTYRNVPLAIEVPKTAVLNAGGNTPYVIRTEGHRRFIVLSIPELEDERTVRVTILTERPLTMWDRLSKIVGSF